MATRKTTTPALDPKVADKLLDKLGTDNDFRRLFKKDPAAALVKVGHPKDAAALTGGCCQIDSIAPKAQIEALRARCGGGLSRPFGRGVGVRPDNALRMNYDYECITITALRKPSPRLTRAPGFASGATERTGAAFRPDGAMIQDQGPDPRGVLQ